MRGMAFPFISVRHPRPYDVVDDKVEVAGIGTGFEGTLVARLRDADGNELTERSFHAGGTGIWGNFFFRIDTPGVPAKPRGRLEVFEVSAEDGSEIHKRVIPIVFGRALVDPFQGFTVYTVRSGDTLAKIASSQHVKGGWRALYQLNRAEIGGNPNVIFPGQRLAL